MGDHYLDQTRLSRSIAAVATAVGQGAIGIVRISGGDAIDIGARIFEPTDALFCAPTHTLHYGRVCSAEKGHIDTVLAAVMRAPNTFTGENTVEFHIHGGSVQSDTVLRATIEAGALPALPGEFTFRRFMSGKIDLTQAESIADLIEAKTELASRVALRNHDGVLRSNVEGLLEVLISLRALCEANIDFVEEDVPELDRSTMLSDIRSTRSRIAHLISTFESCRLLRDGARVALTGAPNVGKSSLFNAILKSERAIVTNVPGTTRDAVTEQIDIHGIPVILADTAGIRHSDDLIEAEGVKRSRAYVGQADLVVDVHDSADGLSGAPSTARRLIVLSKADLLADTDRDVLAAEHGDVLIVSALTGDGIEELCYRIRDMLLVHAEWCDEPVITRRRHFECLERCHDALAGAETSFASREPLELAASELRAATAALEELTGKVYDEAILDRIFGEFCIGK